MVVCDYASFLELAAIPRLLHKKCNNMSKEANRTNNFASLVLDLRHPSASFHEAAAPSPIENVKWWIRLNNFVTGCRRGMKRLVIERTDLPQNRFFSPGRAEGPGGRESRVDEMMLAMKVAFAYHPFMFSSGRASIGKRVVSWARRRARRKKSKSEKYQSVLVASLRRIYGLIADSACVEEPHPPNNKRCHRHFAWELRTCSLGKPQQAAYDRCCLDVQGSDEDVAEGLLRLRKICIHSDLEDFIGRMLAHPLPGILSSARSYRGRNGSILASGLTAFSEPEAYAAKLVMRKSSKMRELLRVLVCDCGFEAAGKFDLLGAPPGDVGKEVG